MRRTGSASAHPPVPLSDNRRCEEYYPRSVDIAPANFETGDSIHLRFSEAEILVVTSSDLNHTITL